MQIKGIRMDNIQIPWSSIGYLTYKRTYSRVKEDGTTEEFPETVERVIKACDEQLKCGFSTDEEERLRSYLLLLKGSVAGRFWWQLGTDTVNRFGLASLQNCAFTVVDDPIVPFCWTMDMLALGAGVGFSVQGKHVNKIPPVKDWFKKPTRQDDGGADYIIPDSREGWVKFLGKVLKSAFLSDSEEKGTFTYSTQVIRGMGLPIKGFGGTSSGPEALVIGINKISDVLSRRKGRQIRPIDALDIMCIIGELIVAGNVRRSALSAIGDHDDIEFLLAKRWDMGTLPSWRAMSNNSVVCDDTEDLHEYFWQSYENKGESLGLVNLRLAKHVGRLGETQYADPDVEGANPCFEQFLEPWETCCLCELFLPNVKDKYELMDIAELLYRICKHSLKLPSHQVLTEDVVHNNMRMGIGVSGTMQATEEQNSWLSECYEYLREFDKVYSAEQGMPESIKLTTVKPSGTLSLLPGITPGCHPGFARYMKRRIRIAANHPLVETCRKSGYDLEFVKNFDGSLDRTTVVVTFPFSYPEGTKLAKDTTAIEQLKEIKRLQSVWSDNAVSCTVYFSPDELPEIKKYLKQNYRSCHKSLSFLLRTDNGFIQQPFEEITEVEFNELVARTKPINAITEEIELSDEDECLKGGCPIR